MTTPIYLKFSFNFGKLKRCVTKKRYSTVFILNRLLLQEEELKKQLKPLTPEERAVEKQRIQREQEEADLALAMEAFG